MGVWSCVNNWCSEVESIFDDINNSVTYDNRLKCDINDCRTRLCDAQVLQWSNGKLDKPKLRTYNLVKQEFIVENYVKYCDKSVRSHLCQIRCGILPLEIETGRHRKIELQNRMCKLCNLNEVEDEFHFICKCPLYNYLRKDLYNNMNDINDDFDNLNDFDKFTFILKKSNNCVGRYVLNCFQKRRSFLYK